MSTKKLASVAQIKKIVSDLMYKVGCDRCGFYMNKVADPELRSLAFSFLDAKQADSIAKNCRQHWWHKVT